MNELENVDDEADVFKIRFVRIHDVELAEDYSLYYMPSLVYFRKEIPIVYNGMLQTFHEYKFIFIIVSLNKIIIQINTRAVRSNNGVDDV